MSDEAATTVDDAARAPLYEQFQEMLNESGPFFPLFQPTASVVSVTDRVANAAFHPDDPPRHSVACPGGVTGSRPPRLAAD